MQLLKEDISEEFVEGMVDKVISRLTDKLEQLDISLDFIASLLSDTDAVSIGGQQRAIGRMYNTRAAAERRPKDT